MINGTRITNRWMLHYKPMTRIAALVFMLAASSFVWAQTGNAPQPSNQDDVLKRKVRDWIVDREDTFTHLITFSLITTKTPGGVIFAADADENTRYKLDPSGLTLREVLDAFVSVYHRYRWTVSDGVVNLTGVEMNPPLLDTVVANFDQENLNAETMIETLEYLPEVQRQAIALGFTDIGLREYIGPISTKLFGVHCRNQTLRQVLDLIVRTHGRAIGRTANTRMPARNIPTKPSFCVARIQQLN
jgi:hypothetical protein